MHLGAQPSSGRPASTSQHSSPSPSTYLVPSPEMMGHYRTPSPAGTGGAMPPPQDSVPPHPQEASDDMYEDDAGDMEVDPQAVNDDTAKPLLTVKSPDIME